MEGSGSPSQGIDILDATMPESAIPEIVISAAEWKNADDFYVAFLAAVGAPSWHGRNLDALWDSIVAGSINRTEPPYRVRITGIGQIPNGCREMIDNFRALIEEASAQGTPVEVVCGP
jgi:RNAse (barnase) inhibitor barstar